MKKQVLSWLVILCVVVCLLSGCGKAAPTPTLADCGTVDGVLMHTGAEKYSYTESDGVVTTDNKLFVPAGTVIESEQDIAVYPYTKSGILDITTLAETGQETIAGYMVVMASGAVTVPQDSYIRVVVRGAVEDVVLTYPEERRGEVRVFDNQYEAYQKDEERIQPLLKKAKNKAVNYIFITDLHNDRGSMSEKQRNSLDKQIEIVAKMASENDAVDFVVIGGDNTSGMFDDKNKSIRYTQELLEPLKNCGKPVLILMGNHDDNSYSVPEQAYTESDVARLVSKAQWNKDILQMFAPSDIVHDSKNADSAYYYYDLPDKKTRLVCLDAIDYVQQADENGNIIPSSLEINEEGNTITGRSQWGYSVRQLQWLAEEALTADRGWNYVFLSHMNAQDSYSCGGELKALLTAFAQRTAYTDETVGTFDFSDATGRIMSYQYGHVHVEKTKEDTEMGLWRIATATANIAQLSDNDASSENYRAFGTDTEACFDVMSVTTDAVQKYAFGAGSDAEMKNPQGNDGHVKEILHLTLGFVVIIVSVALKRFLVDFFVNVIGKKLIKK